MTDRTTALERLLAAGQDSPVLRLSLGLAHLESDPGLAATHLRAALAQDPAYTAAWKQLGKALTACGDTAGAANAYERGIAAAEKRGDVQATKEMRVFLKRLTGARPSA